MFKIWTIFFFVFSFFCTSTNLYSQHRIKGIVVDVLTKEKIPFVSILIKETDDKIIDYTQTDDKGYFEIILESRDLKSIVLETSILGYLSSQKELLLLKEDNNHYEVNFNLTETSIRLDEVYIETSRKAINIKQDTTFYDINQFKDGSERVVEDILKKLPGISVSENGAIKFKGKQVTQVLLDNDNVFDSNYTVGTKNIGSEIVEGIQAIEDYNTNPLLKGIKTSEEIAINLILKKGKYDVSGNGEIAFGFDDKKLLKANVLSVSKKVKGFSTFSHNNIGEDYSPYNFVSNSIDIGKANEFEQRSSNLVQSINSNSSISDDRVRINNNFFGSANGLFKFNDKLSIRGNYSFYKDELVRKEELSNFYNLDSDFSISTQRNSKREPLIKLFNYEIIYKINKKSYLTSIGKIENQQFHNGINGFNNENVFKNSTKSEDVFFKSTTEFTNRINDGTVLQVVNTFSINQIPQNIDTNYETDNYFQYIETKKKTFKLHSTLLSKIKKNEYSILLGYNYTENGLISDLNELVIENQYNSNNINYRLSESILKINYIYRANKWGFFSTLNSNLLKASIEDENIEANFDKYYFIVEPSFSFQYYLNKTSHLYFDYSLLNQLPNIENVYSGIIMTDNRTFSNNDFKFDLFYNHKSTVGYKIVDLYNLFQFNLFTSYNYKKYGYVSQLNISQDLDFFTSLTQITDNKSIQFWMDLEKYIHWFKSTLNFKSSYSINKYQNIINDSGLRDNIAKSFLSEFYIRTGFKSKLNFENKTILRITNFSNSMNNSNSVSSFQNDFTAKFSKSNFLFSVKGQYFNPELNNKEKGYVFLDFSVDYKPFDSRIEYSIRANNLLNHNVYRSVFTSDFSSSVFKYSLLERFLLMSVKFKF